MSEWVRALDWRPGGPWLESRCGNLIRFGTLVIPFTPLGQCLSEETLKAVGPFYWVSIPGEVKDPTSLHWKCVTAVVSTTHSYPPPHWRTALYRALPIIRQDKTLRFLWLSEIH